MGRFDFRGYDLVLSSSHCVAKGPVLRRAPARVLLLHAHALRVGPLRRTTSAMAPACPRAWPCPRWPPALRAWDRRPATRVHHFVAISEHVRTAHPPLLRAGGRRSIYPPVDVQRFELADGPEGDFYLVVSALVPYKRIDLAIAGGQARSGGGS